jgi:hypothetical protein
MILMIITHSSVHSRPHFKLNRSGEQFHKYKVCNCAAILHSMVRGLAILRALYIRLANATS